MFAEVIPDSRTEATWLVVTVQRDGEAADISTARRARLTAIGPAGEWMSAEAFFHRDGRDGRLAARFDGPLREGVWTFQWLVTLPGQVWVTGTTFLEVESA